MATSRLRTVLAGGVLLAGISVGSFWAGANFAGDYGEADAHTVYGQHERGDVDNDGCVVENEAFMSFDEDCAGERECLGRSRAGSCTDPEGVEEERAAEPRPVPKNTVLGEVLTPDVARALVQEECRAGRWRTGDRPLPGKAGLAGE